MMAPTCHQHRLLPLQSRRHDDGCARCPERGVADSAARKWRGRAFVHDARTGAIACARRSSITALSRPTCRAGRSGTSTSGATTAARAPALPSDNRAASNASPDSPVVSTVASPSRQVPTRAGSARKAARRARWRRSSPATCPPGSCRSSRHCRPHRSAITWPYTGGTGHIAFGSRSVTARNHGCRPCGRSRSLRGLVKPVQKRPRASRVRLSGKPGRLSSSKVTASRRGGPAAMRTCVEVRALRRNLQIR